MVNIILLSLILPIIAFVFESYPRFLNRKFGVDVWTHLLYLKELHKQRGIPKKIKNGFLIPGDYDYPPAFIFILSKLPFSIVEKYEFLFSPFFDFLHLILIFFISYFLTGNIVISIITQVLYTLTPIIILENSSASPRSLGYMLFTAMFFSLFLFMDNGNIYLLLSAVFFGSLIFLSHRFTTQGFLFFSIFFSFLDRDIIYFGVFLMSFVFAVIISKGFYLKVLQGHIGNLIFWYNNIDYRFFHQIKGSYKDHKTKDFIFKMYNQFLKFPPFVLSVVNPWTLPVFYIFFFYMPTEYLLRQLVWWVIFSYVLALLTSWVHRLRFLGESQRYLELSAFPSAFLSTLLLVDISRGKWGSYVITLYVIVCILSFITILFIQRKAIIKDKLRTVTPDMEKMFSYLKTLTPKPKILCIPHQITTNTIYHTGCPVFVNADYSNINKISDVYPWVKRPLREIMREYNLDLVLLNNDYAGVDDLKIKKYKIINQVGNFVILKVY